jgi:hypothetical protein
MADLLFDKLAYLDRLTRAGVAEETARAHADAMDEALRESVVTKPYLETRLAQLETRLTLRTGAITAAGVAVLTAIKFFG